MKVVIASFNISQWGGIVQYMKDMLRAFHELGHEVDVVTMTSTAITPKSYDKKIKAYESGEYNKEMKDHSQSNGYQKDDVVGYWFNAYYGYFLPPGNRIGVFEPDALDQWHKVVDDADIILWNFMPTKTSDWNRKDGSKFDFWWKFFDLPEHIKQVFLVHDAYFNVRASNISALKEKIHFMACAHLAAYHCCSEIGIPKSLLLNPRYIDDDAKMPIIPMNKRKEDVFAAHIFKSMKHMEELIAAIPYLNKGEEKYEAVIAGTGVECYYMMSEEKIKPCYMCTKKRDPNLPDKLDGKISIWNRGLKYGMNFLGQIPGDEVLKHLENTKFAVDPSWAEHYAQYCRTHINGFIIEAMLHGAYPVLRDYKGLKDGMDDIYDPLFDNIRAIIIPYDATPKEFGLALREATKMSPKKFLKDTLHNFNLVTELFNSKKNAEEIIRLCKIPKKKLNKELECGKDSENVKRITIDLMENFFGIELPIEWETE